MLQAIPSVTNNLLLHSGNILTINEVKKKAGQSSTDELLESFRFVFKNRLVLTTDEIVREKFEINKVADYEAMKLFEQQNRKDVKVSVKIFVSSFEEQNVREAIDAAFKYMVTPYIESVVLALRAGENLSSESLRGVWKVLEEFASDRRVYAIGVSDVETDAFVALYEWAKVKPGIVQINLAHCCVVPPALESFAKDHEIRLLTHSDPPDILPAPRLKELLDDHLELKDISSEFMFSWAARYQMHIKCRGVLTSKGYIVCLKK